MTNELFRGILSDIAKIYTTLGLSKVSQDKVKLDSQKKLYVNKKVLKDGIQARINKQQNDYSYVVVSADDRLDLDFLAFLINSMPWKVMLGVGYKFLEGINTPTSLSALKKLPVVILSDEEQKSCVFLNTLITSTFDGMEKDSNNEDELKLAFQYLLGIRDNIALEILLDGILSSPDISVLSAWIEKKKIYDSSQNKKEAFFYLFKSIFSSNDELRDRMNKMRLFIDENADTIFNQLTK